MSADQQNPQDRQNQDAQETQQIQDVQQTQPITDAKASVTGGKTNGDTAEAPGIDGVSWNWAATHRGEAQPADDVAKASAQARQAPGGQPHQPSQAPEQNGQVSGAGQAARAGQAAGAGQTQAPPQASPYGYAPQSYPQQPYPQQPQYQSPYGVPGAYPAPTGTQKKPKKPSKIRTFLASLNTGTIVFAAVAALICGLLGGVAGGFIVRAATPSRQQQTVQPYGYGRMMPGSSNGSGSGSSSGSESNGSSSSSDDSGLGLGLGGSGIFNDTGSM